MIRDLLPFVVTGVLAGTVYGLAATGLVLTFKTSGILNFGHGAILTAGAALYYAATVSHGLDWKVGVVLSVLVAGPLMGIVMEFVARGLARQRVAMRIVGTVGLIVLVPSLVLIAYPESGNGLRVERFLPFSDRQRYKIELFDVNVFGDQLLVAGISLVCVGGLWALFSFTRLGSEMRAAVDDPDLLALQGTDPVRVRRIAWIIGCTFASLSGVLLVPAVNVQPYTLTFLATYAFGAAAFGAFRSIPLALAGGLLVGLAEDVSGFFIRKQGWVGLGGLSEAMPFVILFAVLLILPARKFVTGDDAVDRPPLQYQAPPTIRLGAGVVVFAALAAVPVLFESQLPFFTLGLCQALLVLSLGVLVRTSGQMSLCHATFAAIGAVAFSQFSTGMGLPWLVAFFLAGLVVVPVGAVVALPAIRLSGVYLALATFGFGILVQRLFFPQSWMFFTFSGSRVVPAPAGFTTRTGYYYLVLIVLAVSALVVALLLQSRIGRLLRGMSDAPVAVSTMGLTTSVTKLIVFCLSSFLAGLAGVMYGGAYGNIDSTTPPFQTFNSLILVAILALAPFREPWYALVAGVAAVIPGFVTGETVPEYLNLGFGVAAVAVAMHGAHPGMPERLQHVLNRIGRRRPPVDHDRDRPVHEPRRVDPDRAGLEVDRVGVTFGGLVAVDEVSFAAPVGTITGLIGPNGAGKTTTFDVISGLNRRADGTVSVHGRDVTSFAPPRRGRAGIGRTFQRVQLADTLSVFDNVALGAECGQAGGSLVRQLVAPPGDRARMLAATHDALAVCGIAHLAGTQTGSLSTGERRLVELARCLAGDFDVLLLDEPSSGLDRDETERFGGVLLAVVAERGCGILLVEHDMELVMRVCDHIHVLDFGRKIFDGSPAEAATSPIVRAAYLGDDEVDLRPAEVTP